MSHQLRFFRFNHRTHIPTSKDLTAEEFFTEQQPSNQEDIPLLEDLKSRPQKQATPSEP